MADLREESLEDCVHSERFISHARDHSLARSLVGVVQLDLVSTHGTIEFKIVLARTQWHCWSAEVQLAAAMARVSHGNFWD